MPFFSFWTGHVTCMPLNRFVESIEGAEWEVRCYQCGRNDDEHVLLLCDECETGAAVCDVFTILQHIVCLLELDAMFFPAASTLFLPPCPLPRASFFFLLSLFLSTRSFWFSPPSETTCERIPHARMETILPCERWMLGYKPRPGFLLRSHERTPRTL